MDTSQISVYLGLDGFSWKMPFISRDTSGCCPTHVPFSRVMQLDKALLAVLMALYVRPCWQGKEVEHGHYRRLNVTDLPLIT